MLGNCAANIYKSAKSLFFMEHKCICTCARVQLSLSDKVCCE